MSPMKSLPDHGDEFWAMFPGDGEGGIVLTEIATSIAPGDAADDDVRAIAESMEPQAA